MTLRLTTLSLVALLKYGYWQDSPGAPFVGEPMSYAQIVAKPRRPHPPKAGAPREVQVLDAQAQGDSVAHG